MNKKAQGQREREGRREEDGESGRRRRGTLFKQIPNFETMAGERGRGRKGGKEVSRA